MAYKSTKRSEQAANTKARIFAAAMDLFAENGVENVTISEIACQAHCSVGNIYHYFHNKEEIAACLTTPLDQQYQEFMDLFQHNPQYTKLDPTEKIISFFCEIVHITATGQFFASAINHGLRHPEDGLLRVHKGRIYWKILYDLLSDWAKSDFLPSDYDEIINYLLTLVRGLSIEWHLSNFSFDLEVRSRQMIKIFLAGLTQIHNDEPAHI